MDITFFKPHFKSLSELMPNKKQSYQTPRQRVWIAIRNNADEFTIRQVAEEGLATYESTRYFVSTLRKAGFIQCTKTLNKEKYFKLIQDCGYAYPSFNKDGTIVKDVTGNKAMWNTLRITQMAINAHELASISSTGNKKIALETANNYLIALHKAGYVKRVEEAKTTGGKAKYMLLPHMNTGAKPPQVQRVKQVFDPNLNETMYSERPELDEEAQHGVLGSFYA
ncbi:hypothetical protein [Acinetobacter nectaris]|uniref:hypothetical protein n=1 Tax=Acinetobacter nectaris TaxID=1219382 RepID=UPI001F379E4C|nr:hypothetical protein [Acinetobacter nectaris]MCF8999264.1 hypothetical protein [Acinetobacter nectaris]MCF9028129.1 hypothetical protein [Acinetobacter nectaris]